jgi:hypothetical protein
MKWLLFLIFVLSSVFSLANGGIISQNSKSDFLSIEGCEFYYDDKEFDFEQPLEVLFKTLGEPEQYFVKERKAYKSTYTSWESIGISIQKSHNDAGDKRSVFFINLIEDNYRSYKWYRYENGWSVNKIYTETPRNYGNAYPYKGFVLDGKKINPGISYKDFFDLYNYSLKDFEVDGGSYMLKRPCGNGKSIYFDIGQGGGWTYKGSGHLTYKDKYIPIRPDPIRYIYIWFE